MAKTLLNLQATLKRRGWVALPVLTSAVGAALLYLLTSPPTYRASSQIIVNEKEISVSDLGQGLTEIGTNAPGTADPIATQAELIYSQGVLRRALSTANADPEQLPSTNGLRRAMEVDILPGTNILRLRVKHTDPEITANLTNAIAQATVAENIESIRREAEVVREFLEKKIPQQQARLSNAEFAEGRYRQSSGIVDLEAQTEQLVNRRAALEAERAQVLAQLEATATQVEQLQGITGTAAPEVAFDSVRLGQDETLQELQQEITDLEVAMSDAASRLGEQHPEWLALLDERQSLEELYQQRLATFPSQTGGPIAADDLSQNLLGDYINTDIERQSLVSRLAVLDNELNNMSQRLLQLPVQQQPLASLVRQREEAETALNFLQSKLEEARLAEAQLVSNVRIIGEAEVPRNPIAPKPAVVLLLALMAGTAVSVALIVLMEALDLTLRTARDAESSLKLPVLGILPKLPRRNLVSRLENFFDTPEQIEPYRSLFKTLSLQRRTSSQLNAAGNGSGSRDLVSSLKQQGQVIVITSPFDRNSKSSVALHLAATAAMLSKKTLLIDADFRTPSQDSLFSVPLSPGLTDVMQTETPLEAAVQSTPVEFLSLLTNGQRVSRPSALAEGDAIRTLLAEAAASYDVVIVDTSPASQCADAASLSRYTDGLLLVLRAGVSQKAPSVHVALELKKSGVPVLGIAMDNVAPGQEGMYIDHGELQLIDYTDRQGSAREEAATPAKLS